jgi:hypothetical protein
MNKKDKVFQILTTIKDRTDELLEDENTSELTAEETVIIATEMTLNYPITTIEYTQPIGIVDRSRVSFMLDEEFDVPLFEGEDYEEK